MALTAPSDFVWLIDDDIIPGNKYLAQLMHAAGTELLGTSLLGSIGRVLPRPGRDMSLVSYRKVRFSYRVRNFFYLSRWCVTREVSEATDVLKTSLCTRGKW